MSNFSTWLLAIFMVMFWIFRAIVALCTQYSIDFMGLTTYNFNWEVIIAFATLLCIILVVKRKLAGSLLYLLLYGVYFGEHFVSNIILLLQGQSNFDVAFYMNLLADFIAILLAIFVLLDMLVDKGRKANPKDKNTDWFYKNKDFDRKLDDRADKNNYRTL